MEDFSSLTPEPHSTSLDVSFTGLSSEQSVDQTITTPEQLAATAAPSGYRAEFTSETGTSQQGPSDEMTTVIAKLVSKLESVDRWGHPGGDALSAVNELSSIGAAAVPALINALSRKESVFCAAQALGLIGSDAKDAVPNLIGVLGDEWKVGNEAATALGLIGVAAVPALITGPLSDPSDKIRTFACEALGLIGSASKDAVPALIDIVSAKSEAGWDLRNYAVKALGQIGPEAKDAVPALINIFSVEPEFYGVDGTGDPRVRAMEALGRIGPEAKDAVPALINFVSAMHDDWSLCRWAVEALGHIGAAAKDAVPDLINALRDSVGNGNYKKGEDVYKALLLICNDAKIVPASIIALLADPHEDVRCIAPSLILLIGSAAKDAVPDLINALADPSEELRSLAAAALGQVGPAAKDAIPDLINLLRNDESLSVRANAALALGELGPTAKGAVPDMINALHSGSRIVRKGDENAFLRHSAAWALGKLDPEAKDIVIALIVALTDSDESVRNRVVESLGRIGGEVAVKAIELAVQRKLISSEFATSVLNPEKIEPGASGGEALETDYPLHSEMVRDMREESQKW